MAVKTAARDAGFTLVGLTDAVPLDPAPLRTWLDAGHHAGMDWMATKTEQRLDPAQVLPGARTVIALAIAYHQAEPQTGVVSRYARGGDYHNIHRRRLRKLRRSLLALAPDLETYACVDTGLAMEKVWAERAGLGFIGKNGCLIHPRLGSWLTLSVLFVDRAVDQYDAPTARACGACTLCLSACPTNAFAAPGVVDARRCVSYQSIENDGSVPAELREAFAGRVFGCDVCQDVCPFNRGQEARGARGDAHFLPRRLGLLPAASLVRLTREEYTNESKGSPLVRPGHDGIRRNALLAIGAVRDTGARETVAALIDDPAPVVSESARWALTRIDGGAK